MKQLPEFATYQEAVDYEACKKITSNKADQFLSLSGIKTKITNNLSNEALVELIPNSPTTIGLICDVIIQTLSKTGYAFELDEDTEGGQYNLAALSALVEHNVVSEADSAMFIGLGKYKPYAGVTESEYNQQKAAQEYFGESDCAISYAGTLKGEQPHFVTAGKTSIKFEITLAEPAPKDSVVTLTYREKGEGETDFARVDNTFRQAILAGETKVNSRDYSVSTMNRHIDFSASIDTVNANCSVNVVGK